MSLNAAGPCLPDLSRVPPDMRAIRAARAAAAALDARELQAAMHMAVAALDFERAGEPVEARHAGAATELLCQPERVVAEREQPEASADA